MSRCIPKLTAGIVASSSRPKERGETLIALKDRSSLEGQEQSERIFMSVKEALCGGLCFTCLSLDYSLKILKWNII